MKVYIINKTALQQSTKINSVISLF